MELYTKIVRARLESQEYCNIPLSVGFFRVLDTTQDGDYFVGYVQSRIGDPIGLAPYVMNPQGVYDPVPLDAFAEPLKLLFGRQVSLLSLVQRTRDSLDVTPNNLKSSARKAVVGAYSAGLLSYVELHRYLVFVPRIWFTTERHYYGFMERVPKVEPLKHGRTLVALAQEAVASACMKGWRHG